MSFHFTSRFRRVRAVVGACLLGAVSAWSGAASAAPRVMRLSAPVAIRLALANNPDARSTEQDVVAARGAVQQARVLPNPSIFVSALGTQIRPAQAPIPNQFGVTWTIPIGGKRAAAIASARADVSAAEAGRLSARRQLAYAVESAFVAVLLDKALLAFAREDQQTFRSSVAINEYRYKGGKIAYGEVLKLRIQARAVDDTVRQSEQTLSSDRLELQRLVGTDALSPAYEVVGSLSAPRLPLDLSAQTLARRALAKRADYRALFSQLESSRSALSLAHRQPIPDLDVLADYNVEPGGAGNYDLQLGVAIPLFDRNQGNITQARAAYEKARLAISGMHAQISADAGRAVEEWRIARQRLTAYSDDFVKTAKESLDISRHSYEEGRGSILDYLDAESSYRDVQRAYLSAQAEAVLAAASIRFVTGEELR